jgi:hypothetical protein
MKATPRPRQREKRDRTAAAALLFSGLTSDVQLVMLRLMWRFIPPSKRRSADLRLARRFAPRVESFSSAKKRGAR